MEENHYTLLKLKITETACKYAIQNYHIPKDTNRKLLPLEAETQGEHPVNDVNTKFLKYINGLH